MAALTLPTLVPANDYFAIVVGGIEFHIKKKQLPPLNRGQEVAAKIEVYNPRNPEESMPLHEVEAIAGIREQSRLSKYDNKPLDYLLTYGTETTKNVLQHYYPVNLISECEGHLVADVDYQRYPVDATCIICQELLPSHHSLSRCVYKRHHIYHTKCLAHWLQEMYVTSPCEEITPRTPEHKVKCPACWNDFPSELCDLLSEKGCTSELHRTAKAGESAIVKALLEAQVDIEAQDEQGNTALHLAAQAGHSDIVLMLIDYGVNFEAENYAGQRPD